MPVYPVADTPNFVSGVFARPYIVKNSGSNTVFLGQDSSLTESSRAFSLEPGSTLNWNGTTELWSLTRAGETSELEILYTGENSFTPGPNQVSIDSAVIELANETVAAGVSLSGYSLDIPAKYQFISISATGLLNTAFTTNSPYPSNTFNIRWEDDAGNPVFSEQAEFSRAGTMLLGITKRTNRLVIDLSTPGLLGASFSVIAYTSALTPYYEQTPDPFNGGAFITGVATKVTEVFGANHYGLTVNTGVAVSRIYLPSFGGDNFINIWNQPALNFYDFDYYDNIALNYWKPAVSSVANTNRTATIKQANLITLLYFSPAANGQLRLSFIRSAI